MKFFISIFVSLILTTVSAEDNKEYIVTGSDITETKTFELENKSKFSSFTVNGSWTDNFGNYGFNKCMGIINKNLKNVELYFMCEREDKNGFKIWSINKRKSGIQNSGVGSFEIVDATIPKKELFIGKKMYLCCKIFKRNKLLQEQV